jgi:Ca2+-binding RTX toxin-like protein
MWHHRNVMLRRVAGLAVLVALSVAPGPASAASLGVNGSTLEYRAASGVTDRFFPTYRRNRDFYWVGADFADIVARPSCSRGNDPDARTPGGVPAPVIVSCPAAGVRVADVQLGDRNDTMGIQRDEIYRPDGEHDDALLPVHALVVHADGGPGNDTVDGEGSADILLGGLGNDALSAFGGNDLVRGGPGKDSVQGGNGRDRIYGDSGNDLLFGVGGTDRLYGGAGKDNLNGGGFAFGADRRDTIYGGAGADKLTDSQNGKESAGDRFFGGSGNDRIDDRDGNRDIIDCGTGRDTVIADQRDKVAGNCERVRRKFRPPGKR